MKRRWFTISNPMDNPVLRAMFSDAVKQLSHTEAYQDGSGLRVILTHETYGTDTRHWLHISVSRADRWPSWEDLLTVKDEFIGEEAEAYQVLPRHSEYVNVHPNCFHLFHCLDGEIMPH